MVIDLKEGEDDEQAIFDTLNTTGVRLTTTEIFKNAIFQKAMNIFGSKESAIYLYKNKREKTFLPDKDTVKYWKTERLTDRLKKTI